MRIVFWLVTNYRGGAGEEFQSRLTTGWIFITVHRGSSRPIQSRFQKQRRIFFHYVQYFPCCVQKLSAILSSIIIYASFGSLCSRQRNDKCYILHLIEDHSLAIAWHRQPQNANFTKYERQVFFFFFNWVITNRCLGIRKVWWTLFRWEFCVPKLEREKQWYFY